MLEFLKSFAQYGVVMILLAAIAAGGIVTGKVLRKRKDLQNAKQTEE